MGQVIIVVSEVEHEVITGNNNLLFRLSDFLETFN